MLSEITAINLSHIDGAKLQASVSEVSTPVAKKRPMKEDEATDTVHLTPAKEFWSEERLNKRAKKFRVEWMNEDYFKDWLRPHPTDETYCICVACDIRLRCGKSELEKHASGLKHCKRLEAMKENPNHVSRLAMLSDSSQSQTEQMLSEENGTFYVATEDLEHSAAGVADSALSKALIKLSKYLDDNSDIAQQKLKMAELEHQRRMQVLNKELELRAIEVLIRQKELQNLHTFATLQKPELETQSLIIHNVDDDELDKS